MVNRTSKIFLIPKPSSRIGVPKTGENKNLEKVVEMFSKITQTLIELQNSFRTLIYARNELKFFNECSRTFSILEIKRELVESRKQLCETQRELAIFKNDKEDWVRKQKALNNDLYAITKEYEKNKQELVETRSICEKWSSHCAAQNSDNNELKTNIEKLESDKKVLNSSLQDSEKTISELRAAMKKLASDRKFLITRAREIKESKEYYKNVLLDFQSNSPYWVDQMRNFEIRTPPRDLKNKML